MKAILFDIDDTLYDQIIPFREALERVFPHIKEISAEELFKVRSRHSEVSFRMSLNQEMTMEEMYCYRIRKAFEDFQVTVSDEEAMAFQKAYEDGQKQLRLSKAMEQALIRCRDRNVVLGVISNGPAYHQRAKARTLGLERFFPEENIIISGEVGIVKPDAGIFRIAEERLGISARRDEAWYVGDSYQNDVAGASKAGFHTIWLNRRRKPLPPAKEDGESKAGESDRILPDRCVHSDEELLSVIREMV